MRLTVNGFEHEVVSVYDHRHLNREVPEFRSSLPTTENIAIAIWKRLEGKIPGAKLHRVRVYEMPDLFADFNQRIRHPGGFHLTNPPRQRVWNTGASRNACTRMSFAVAGCR